MQFAYYYIIHETIFFKKIIKVLYQQSDTVLKGKKTKGGGKTVTIDQLPFLKKNNINT
jgi:hypothetical protein